jgi:hypothetical protein
MVRNHDNPERMCYVTFMNKPIAYEINNKKQIFAFLETDYSERSWALLHVFVHLAELVRKYLINKNLYRLFRLPSVRIMRHRPHLFVDRHEIIHVK